MYRIQSTDDMRALARRRVPRFVFEYIDSSAGDEDTARRNREALAEWHLVPRTLVNTLARQAGVRLFGQDRASPIIVAPTGFNGLARAQGDLMLARAAQALGLPFVMSSFSNVSLETLVEQTGVVPWMQLYCLRDFGISREIAARADAAGCEVLVVTSDANWAGARERNRRCYRRPGKLDTWHALEAALHPGWLWGMLRHGRPRFANLSPYLPPGRDSATGGMHFVGAQVQPTLDWDHIAALRACWPRHLVLKGVLHPDDAKRARDLGVDGVVVSNHGGRQLESCVSPIDVLPRIREALGADYPLIVDSGFRRGVDIVKAMALGASAVMVGRAAVYGLAAAGQSGASRALALLRDETDRSLGLLGCNAWTDIQADMLVSLPRRSASRSMGL